MHLSTYDQGIPMAASVDLLVRVPINPGLGQVLSSSRPCTVLSFYNTPGIGGSLYAS